VALPVHVGNSLTARATRELIHPASLSAPDHGALVTLAQATTCSVLHLDLGAVNLNLLGVVVATMPVTIDINGDTGGPLGKPPAYGFRVHQMRWQESQSSMVGETSRFNINCQ
jgi:hypothetical protein